MGNADTVHISQLMYKPSSPTLSSFTASKILPRASVMEEELNIPAAYLDHKDSVAEFGHEGQRFEDLPLHDDIDHLARKRFSTDELSSYDLAAPPPTVSHTNAEYLAGRLFSADHLNVILKDQALFNRFTAFLNRYRPHSAPTLVRYLESQKALTAVRYANSVADSISTGSRRSSSSSSAAVVDSRFESLSKKAIDELVSDALPSYITYRMVSIVTECLVKEITGSNTPLMKDLVQGLAEVYCMSDPTIPDNPIVFASEEFYNTTQYGRDYAIGKNCRFLQGPKTQREAVQRISQALKDGVEVCEILLNYKRDGTPFLNLVMMAPLMDHRGNVRYFVGCQIDISNLIEGGRGLESFKTLLDADAEKPLPDPLDQKPPLKMLRELGNLLNDEEIEVVKVRGERRNSFQSGRSTPTTPTRTKIETAPRRYVGMDDPVEQHIWPPSQFGPSGRLPGVYQNYILVRPYPSLRIIFTSSALRIPGLSQSRLMDRIGGPQHVREGLLDALSQGVGVTAKISWLTQSAKGHGNTNKNSDRNSSPSGEDFLEGKPRWIHCTPLLGSDSKVGVIMIVMVDKEEITGSLNPSRLASPLPIRSREQMRDGWPMKGLGQDIASARFTSGKLYAEYLRREGRDARQSSDHPPRDREWREKSIEEMGRPRTASKMEGRGRSVFDIPMETGRVSMASRRSNDEGMPMMREGAVRRVSVKRINGHGNGNGHDKLS
ncbi:hypothetical protein BDV96DRAFT_261913 [Lophiotrema nucula]|uniref:PAC domain-containing protein n=1 Tax=Lophiotrema nucula TaxID=690887 RepID=A0A6A5YN62_9PLEO|nr:hypothetical protein BDV96DRAFT_261913 [Lophiotrema nucula]